MSLSESITAENFKPVSIDTLILSHLFLELFVIGVAIDVIVVGSLISHHRHVGREGVVHVDEIFTKLHSLLGIHEIDIVVSITWATYQFQLCGIGDVRRSCLTLLGGDHDDTIGSTRAIESGGSGILEDVYTFDILGIDARDGIAYIVDIVGVIELFGGHIDRVSQLHSIEHP